MKKEYLITALIVVIIVFGAAVYKFYFSAGTNPLAGGIGNQNSVGSELSPQTNNEGAVEVSVVPQNFSPTTQSWDFQIALNTHSEELDADMVEVSALVDEYGREYLPLSWDGAPPGGHHREGLLRFAPVSPRPKSIILKIRGVGSVAERSFRWMLP